MKHIIKLMILIFFSFGCNTYSSNKITKNEITLLIKENLVNCQGLYPKKCMLIKEIRGQEWEYFYDNIVSFKYEEHYRYKITVEKINHKTPYADASSFEYKLITILEKKYIH